MKYRTEELLTITLFFVAVGVAGLILFCIFKSKWDQLETSWLHILELEVKAEKAQTKAAAAKEILAQEESVLKVIQGVLEQGKPADEIQAGGRTYTKLEINTDVMARVKKCQRLKMKIKKSELEISKLTSLMSEAQGEYTRTKKDFNYSRTTFGWEKPEWEYQWKQEYQEPEAELELETAIDWTDVDGIVDWANLEGFNPTKVLQEYFSDAE